MPFEICVSDFENFVSKLIFGGYIFFADSILSSQLPSKVSQCWVSKGFRWILVGISEKSSYLGAQKELEGPPGHF